MQLCRKLHATHKHTPGLHDYGGDMRTTGQIEELLRELDDCCADDLEGQDLDFKAWDASNAKKAIRKVAAWAICMANGGGGTIVFGVADKIRGRDKAIIGVPPEVDVNQLKLAIYDTTEPRITPVFEELRVPEGTGRLIVMHVYPGIPPYTDTGGRGSVRIGKDCKPLTGPLRRKLSVETGADDITAEEAPVAGEKWLSAAAMEMLRDMASMERAPADLLRLDDQDLLDAVGVVRNRRLTRAALLLSGSSVSIQDHMPGYAWTHLRMASGTDYADRADGRDAIPIALSRILDRILADNPIQTVRHGLFHFEYRSYPEIALREALLNAFCHADYRLGSPILVKQFANHIEITNPGGLIGGVTPENILHHIPVSRNPCLVDALVRLRLVNRSNLGIERIYTSLLVEGKEPPVIEDLGDAFRLTLRASGLSPSFRIFVSEAEKQGMYLGVDHLLILQYLLRHAEIESSDAARLCQRSPAQAREILSRMERAFGYLDRGGSGRGAYWTLRPGVHGQLAAPGDPGRDKRVDWEAAKTRILSILKQKAQRGEDGLRNKEIRAITLLDRNQTGRLMRELRAEAPGVVTEGHGAGARYLWKDNR